MVFLRGTNDEKEARREVQDENVQRELSHHYILEPIGKPQNTTATQEEHGEAEGFMKENKPLIILPPGPVIIEHNETQDSENVDGAAGEIQEEPDSEGAQEDGGESESEDDTALPFDDHDSGEDKVAAMIAEMQAEMQAEAAANTAGHDMNDSDTEDLEDEEGIDQFIGAPDADSLVNENATMTLPWELDEASATETVEPLATLPADDVNLVDPESDLDGGETESEGVPSTEESSPNVGGEDAGENATSQTATFATLLPLDKPAEVEPNSIPTKEEPAGDAVGEDAMNEAHTFDQPASTLEPVDEGDTVDSGSDLDEDAIEPKSAVPTDEEPVGDDAVDDTETPDSGEPPIVVDVTDAPTAGAEELNDGDDNKASASGGSDTLDSDAPPVEGDVTDTPVDVPPTSGDHKTQDGQIEIDQEPAEGDAGGEAGNGNDADEPGEMAGPDGEAGSIEPPATEAPVVDVPMDPQTSPSPTLAPTAKASAVIIHPPAPGNAPNPTGPSSGGDDSPLVAPSSEPPDINKVSHNDAPEPKDHEEQPHSETTGASDGGQTFGSLCRHPNGLTQQVNCKVVLGIQSHPFAFSGVLLVAFVWACCLCRRACKGRDGRDDRRGEYREVAARYDDVLFQDTFDDNYSASFGDDRSADDSISDDEEEDDWTKGPNIEMSAVASHKEDDLTLEEMNG